MNDQDQKPKRDRKSLRTRMMAAISDAETAATSDATSKNLAAVRLATIQKLLAREHDKKLSKARAEVIRLEGDNERLAGELKVAQNEIARLQAMPAPKPMTDIEIVLQKYEQEKRMAGGAQ
jgi:hypothetical protein